MLFDWKFGTSLNLENNIKIKDQYSCLTFKAECTIEKTLNNPFPAYSFLSKFILYFNGLMFTLEFKKILFILYLLILWVCINNHQAGLLGQLKISYYEKLQIIQDGEP